MPELVVVGLGYVGLPLAEAASHSGFSVTGFDVNPSTVESLNAGRSHIDDIQDDDVEEMRTLGFRATTDPAVIATAETIVICVPTPLGEEGGPDLSAVRASCKVISKHLAQGTLVVLESTTWPGTTEEVVKPILEESGLHAGIDFYLAFSPERIDPGNQQFGFTNTPKVVGGLTSDCTIRAQEFYGKMVAEVVLAKGCREAEMSKLLENTYRHINIALVNEMVKFSRELDVDFWDVIRCASTKPFGFQAFYPGPGVGGHCIPIDPNYLSYRVRARLGYPFRFVELAQEINSSMPRYVSTRIAEILNEQSLSLRGSRILLLGVTYKPGIADQRESPAIPLARDLVAGGAKLGFYDHFVETWAPEGRSITRASNLLSAIEESDIVVHLQPNADYDSNVLSLTDTPILDTRGVLEGPNVVRL